MDFGKWIHQRILLLRSLSLPRSPFSLKALKLWGGGDSVQWNVRTPRFPAPVPAWLPANLGPLCRLKTWTPSSASPAAALEPRPSPAIAILRPTSLGLALQSLVQLALCPAHCETRDRHRLAPPRLSAVPGSETRARNGRPSLSPDLRDLLRRMSLANPRWGAPRIHGELLKLGIEVSQATVAK